MIKDVLDFLSANRPFYMATVEGSAPKVRPMGFIMEHEGKIWFGMGKHKNVYKQLLANSKVEIVTTAPSSTWVRLVGELVFDDRPELFEEALKALPHLKDIYPEGAGTMGICFFKGTAFFMDMAGQPEKKVDL
ncbi:MAG: pyridoxamine 5'-phosphate oxidase family protein [Deltaproteobacteria bacterium]|jgi:uncharacterized pyridoxamine 5'-phosphate oxidase family protein|nr:pyridoxamine 5'-phosphate oxidase family protein [Deltaproteobacteria bacterium]